MTDPVHDAVRARYGEIARTSGSCCAPTCCSPGAAERPAPDLIGYSAEEQSAVPEGADLGLGCGNPQAIADLKPGEVVLDLGSGAGFDCFLAARAVGPTGRVIGVDMTPEMLARAWSNASKGGYTNVEFRQGQIEALPVADQRVDVVISNCVVNLSPDKAAVYREVFRVLRPGGRVAIADVLAREALSPELTRDLGGLSQAEAARRLGLPLPTLRARVQRGRRGMRRLFELCCALSQDARGAVIEAVSAAGVGERAAAGRAWARPRVGPIRPSRLTAGVSASILELDRSRSRSFSRGRTGFDGAAISRGCASRSHGTS